METTTVKIAAKLLGMESCTVRYYMEMGVFKPAIGQVLPTFKGDKRAKRKKYLISIRKLCDYIGIDRSEINWETGERVKA